jgi:hypothetical protein
MRFSRLKTTICVVAFILCPILLGGATDCHTEPPDHSKGGGAGQQAQSQEVLVTIRWLIQQRTKRLPIEIAWTIHGKTETTVVHPKNDSNFSFNARLIPGMRISVTADQQEKGYLDCSIRIGLSERGQLVDWERRNDPGSVHCEYTNSEGVRA